MIVLEKNTLHIYLQVKDDVIRTIRSDTIDPYVTDDEDTMRRRNKTAPRASQTPPTLKSQTH